MKTIIAGSREFNNQNIMNEYILRLINEYNIKITEVISGTASGADKCGEKFANINNIPIKYFPAKWNDLTVEPCSIGYNKNGKYNKLAGHNRNKEMAEYGEQLIAFSVNNSSGTKNMIGLANKNNLKVIVFNFDNNLNFISVKGL